jgi:uncharacterized membrane protein
MQKPHIFAENTYRPMETTIKYLIYIHAFLGGVGLITGLISILVKKGGFNHKKAGKIFSIAMCSSSLISLVIARMPNHENLFLFLIGIFTIYLILAGNRALTFKSKTKADLIDKLISGSMLLTSVVMLGVGAIGYFQKIENSILYVFFGSFGAFLSARDFKTFKILQSDKKAWLISHVGRMIGALIASVTAFIVAGLNITSLVFWILPTVLGTGYIIFWSRKIKKGAN